MRITIYSKPACPLCERAEELLRRLCPAAELDKVDITGDPELHRRYRDEVPVVAFDGIVRLRGRVSAEAIREAAARA